MSSRSPRPLAAFLALALSAVLAATAAAQPNSPFSQGKLQGYFVWMEPSNQDAQEYSRAGGGFGLNAVLPVPALGNFFAGVIGFDVVGLLSETTSTIDPQTLLRVNQETRQDYWRVYLGGRIGPHGHGFVRPHLGATVGVNVYGISTDIVVPDDLNRENEIRQNLSSETHAVFGYDVSAAVDWNILNRFPVETGVRYLESLNVPQQLGPGAVTVEPTYLQFYLGVGVSFGAMGEMPRD